MDIIRRKPIVWIGDSRKAIREFPDLARQRAGRELARVQLARKRYRAMLKERKAR